MGKGTRDADARLAGDETPEEKKSLLSGMQEVETDSSEDGKMKKGIFGSDGDGGLFANADHYLKDGGQYPDDGSGNNKSVMDVRKFSGDNDSNPGAPRDLTLQGKAPPPRKS